MIYFLVGSNPSRPDSADLSVYESQYVTVCHKHYTSNTDPFNIDSAVNPTPRGGREMSSEQTKDVRKRQELVDFLHRAHQDFLGERDVPPCSQPYVFADGLVYQLCSKLIVVKQPIRLSEAASSAKAFEDVSSVKFQLVVKDGDRVLRIVEKYSLDDMILELPCPKKR